jgi:hypothetical protein
VSNLLWVDGFKRGKTDEDDGVLCWGGWTRDNFCKGVEGGVFCLCCLTEQSLV